MELSEEEQRLELEEAEREAAALRSAIAEGAIPGVTLEDLDGLSDNDDDDEQPGAEQPVEEDLTKVNTKALKAKIQEMSTRRYSSIGLPWMERLDVVVDNDEVPRMKDVDAKDDLQREVVFHDYAVQAVMRAKYLFQQENVPFIRPNDFYAEMVKTDEHMAHVKDRLIFESKKIEAFEQRKRNQEYKLRAKEFKSIKAERKAKAKKDAVRSAAKDYTNDDGDDDYMASMGKKRSRAAADKKYGYGGKRGRFKQNTKAEINDFSKFNPKGNFDPGFKNSSKKKGGSGGNRAGKRARDAARARRT